MKTPADLIRDAESLRHDAQAQAAFWQDIVQTCDAIIAQLRQTVPRGPSAALQRGRDEIARSGNVPPLASPENLDRLAAEAAASELPERN